MKKRHSLQMIAFSVILVNMITNPLANLLYPAYSFWLIEAGVLVAETAILALLFALDLKRSALLSLAANIPTIALSLVVFAL